MLEGFEWPQWLGTPSQFALVVIVLIALIKVWPVIKQMHVTSAEKMCELLTQQVNSLTTRLTKCEVECADHKRELENKILGMEKNRIQEQISLINALMDGHEAESPQLARVRATLEAVQISLAQKEQQDETRPNEGS